MAATPITQTSQSKNQFESRVILRIDGIVHFIAGMHAFTPILRFVKAHTNTNIRTSRSLFSSEHKLNYYECAAVVVCC